LALFLFPLFVNSDLLCFVVSHEVKASFDYSDSTNFLGND
jgi:hypothetical protein